MFDVSKLKPGDEVYRYVWTGGESHDPQELTVVRVNRVTVTVDTKHHGRGRVPHAEIEGYVDW